LQDISLELVVDFASPCSCWYKAKICGLVGFAGHKAYIINIDIFMII
jgi:hypothetical protein